MTESAVDLDSLIVKMAFGSVSKNDKESKEKDSKETKEKVKKTNP
jgi:hypothetical protein